MARGTDTTPPSSGTPEWLRTVNDRTAFRLLVSHGPLSRAQLRSLSGMSKPTASQMVLRLERAGLIEPTGVVAGPRGPNAVTYGIRADSICGVAISMEVGRIEAVVVDPTGSDHPIAVVPLDHQRAPVADVEAAVSAACEVAGVPVEKCSHIVIGVQAAVDEARDLLDFTRTLPGWPEQGARATIAEKTGLFVTIDNDANLATAAERELGTAGPEEDFVYLWLGTGLGAGFDIEQETRRGAAGSAGEVGYLELPLSAAKIDPEATYFTDLLDDDALMKMLNAPTYGQALERLLQEDGALDHYAERLELLTRPLISVLNPALIVLGGPTGTSGGLRLAALLQERVGERVRVTTGRAGQAAVLMGARSRLLKQLRDELEQRIEASA